MRATAYCKLDFSHRALPSWQGVSLLVTVLASIMASASSNIALADHSTPVSFCRGHTAHDQTQTFPPRKLREDRAKVAARLVISKHIFHGGETAYFRVRNIGSTDIGLIGEAFLVERYTGATWIKDSVTPEGFRKVRWGRLPAGKAGPCQHIFIPSDMQAGKYRISKQVLVGREERLKRLISEFEVSPRR